MPSWIFWLITIFVVGLGVITIGALRDRHLNQAREQQMLSPPDRAVPGPGGAAVPHYLSDLQASRSPTESASTELDSRERTALDQSLGRVPRLDTKLAAAGFLTDQASGRAVLDQPRILVCGEPVGSIRSLLAFLEPSLRGGGACVLVAPELDPAVVRTLEVNRIRQHLAVLAVTADQTTRDAVCAATGAEPVSASDLQAGWLPTSSLGTCTQWVSDKRHSWVLGPEDQ